MQLIFKSNWGLFLMINTLKDGEKNLFSIKKEKIQNIFIFTYLLKQNK